MNIGEFGKVDFVDRIGREPEGEISISAAHSVTPHLASVAACTQRIDSWPRSRRSFRPPWTTSFSDSSRFALIGLSMRLDEERFASSAEYRKWGPR